VSEVGPDGVRAYELRPEDFGIASSREVPPQAGDAAASAAIIGRVHAGERGVARDLVLVNAAAALVLAERAADWTTAVAAAAAAVDGGAAARALARLVETSNEWDGPDA
jgi:anthranilate phosphoribosyltransferase